MKIILLGSPGSGKGTQSKLIQSEFCIPQISTGDILREAIREKTPLGMKAEGFVSQGQLVPNQLVIDIVNERLVRGDCANGYILDGFPRTVVQAHALDEFLSTHNQKIDAVVYLMIDDEEVVRRLSSRRACRGCKAGYHLLFSPPVLENVCDECGSDLYQRKDDEPETIRNRLSVYQKETAPLVDYYTEKNLLKKIIGIGDTKEIFKKIIKEIKISS